MKKLFLFFAGIFSVSSYVSAQDGCMPLFPTTQGTVMVTSNYDMNNNLLSTMTYRVNDAYDYSSGSSTQMGFTYMDNTGQVRGTGNIDASCNDGYFSLRMDVSDTTPFMMNALAQNTELIGNFLDYPSSFDSMDPFSTSPFTMDGGEYTVKSKSDDVSDIRVKVYNRRYETSEIVNTPAGSFNASKISFNYDVTRDGTTMRYKGVEWISPNAGIIKTETYDSNGNRINHSELTTFREA